MFLKKNDHVLSFAHKCLVVLTLIFLSDHFLLIWNDIPCFALLSEFDKARVLKEKHWAATVWARGWQQSRLQTWRQTWGRVFSWDVDLTQGKKAQGRRASGRARVQNLSKNSCEDLRKVQRKHFRRQSEKGKSRSDESERTDDSSWKTQHNV